MTADERLRAELDGGPNLRTFKPRPNGHGAAPSTPPSSHSEAEPGPRPPGSRTDEPTGTIRGSLAFALSGWDARTAFAGEAPPQRWLVSRTVPRAVAGIIASAGDLGKSYQCLELCLRVTRGPPGGTCIEPPLLGGLTASYGAAVFLTAEEGREAVHRRVRALDPDGARQANREFPLYILPLPDAGGPFPIVAEERGGVVTTPQFAALREQLRDVPDLALVVLDPLQCFVHADVNTDPRAAALTMASLNMLAAETGATVLATHHVRKEKDAPRNAQEARHLIRGSSALVDQARFAIVLWPPSEADSRRVCKTLGADYAPNAVVMGAVVKSNDGADRSAWTLLRGPTGMLRDVTHALKARGGSREERLAALVGAITAAAKGGRPFTRMGVNGLYQRRAELGEPLAALSRNRLEEMADELLRAGRVVQALATGTTVKWLDVHDGPFARGEGEFAAGASTGRAGRKAC